jgi:hypothetical protein
MQVDVSRAGIPQLIPAVEQFTREVEAQLGGLSAGQLNWKPNPEEWSLGQCLNHLIVVGRTQPATDSWKAVLVLRPRFPLPLRPSA